MSNVVVVDASVALKWVLQETDSDRATMLLDRWINESKQMIAPALFTYEVTNIIYRQIGKGQLTFDEATLGLSTSYRKFVPSATIGSCWKRATKHGTLL